MPNLYATLDQIRAQIPRIESLEDDEVLLEKIEDASRALDGACHIQFYPKLETRYYKYLSTFELDLDEGDLLSVTSLTTFQDGVTITSDKYHLLCGDSYNRQPYNRIELDRSRGAVFGFSGTKQKANKVIGHFGYHDDYTNAHKLSGATVNETFSDSDTALTVSDGTKHKRGQTIKIDSEWLYVSDIAGSVLTVERGLNGSTAASHSSGTAIYIYKPIREVQRVTLRFALWLYKQNEAPFSFEVSTDASGRAIIPPQAPPEVHRFIKQYRRML